ncbi:MAG: Gfo/Idh/MocA family oxidoreductase [Acutalibacteraceae bacterium]|nr:Gfo/Idh/MocA family oxidoreductase [Acutalibacteraceae bacterium]MEE1049053.1 Gfo/Idh/MocA family oxidoreductase [Clostridia bacterium]
MKKYKVGIIGLGLRGGRLARELLTEFPNIEITGLCDLYEDRLKFSVDAIEEKTGIPIKVVTTDYRELIDSEHIDTVFVFSGWENHFDAAVRAMKKRKPIGLEVGGAYSILQCYELVRVYEETQTPFMLLENCCYGEIEMTVTNMVRKGLFGTVVHCDGGYCHEMRNTLSGINRDRHYRVDEYINRNCESYPTHELGPIAKLLNIGNGNRFVSLVSMSSKAAGMKEFLADKDNPYKNVDYAQGDIFTTLIKCAGGETIRITLDTTLPRYYSRDFTIRGTKAMYEERTNSVFFDNNEEHKKKDWSWKNEWGNMEKYMEDYRHPLWVEYQKSGVKGTHGGMDYLVISAFLEALDKDLPMPIDVYDAVSWMVVTALSEQSVALGSAPVAFPDFTGGKWFKKKQPVDSIYNLL